MNNDGTPGALGSNDQLGLVEPSDSDRALWEAMGCIADDEACLRMLRAHIAAAVAAERERILALVLAIAKQRADYEASAAAHHAGRWQPAHEHHLTRHAAMCDLIYLIEWPNAELTGAHAGATQTQGRR